MVYNEVGYRRVPHKKNRAWWKVPIIYGGLGTCGYYFWYNYSHARDFKKEILYRRENGDSTNLFPNLVAYTSEYDLINGFNVGNTSYLGFNTYARRREIFLAASIGIYALAMIEAYVDAHFVTFDVSDDLGMAIMPVMLDKYSPGIKVRFNFL